MFVGEEVVVCEIKFAVGGFFNCELLYVFYVHVCELDVACPCFIIS